VRSNEASSHPGGRLSTGGRIGPFVAAAWRNIAIIVHIVTIRSASTVSLWGDRVDLSTSEDDLDDACIGDRRRSITSV